VIPARGGSRRLRRKNLAQLLGKPLLAYAIEAAEESQVFDQVCVSSEDEEILEVAQHYGADLALKRPPELAADTAQVRHVCAYLLEHFATQGRLYAAFGVLLATSPLRTAEDVRAAYEIFQHSGAECVMSVVPFSHPPQRALWIRDGYAKPYFGTEYMIQTQLLDSLYRHDGAVILARSEEFLRTKQFYGDKVVPYHIPIGRSVDIDSAEDLAWAEFLLTRSRAASEPEVSAG
jgi:CMP-N-acetylneuraminic acid synthetase